MYQTRKHLFYFIHCTKDLSNIKADSREQHPWFLFTFEDILYFSGSVNTLENLPTIRISPGLLCKIREGCVRGILQKDGVCIYKFYVTTFIFKIHIVFSHVLFIAVPTLQTGLCSATEAQITWILKSPFIFFFPWGYFVVRVAKWFPVRYSWIRSLSHRQVIN